MSTPHTVNASLTTIILYTHDMVGLAAFYQQALQLGEPQPTGTHHLGFPLGNVYLGIDLVDEPLAAGPISLWFEVDDLEATYAHILSVGGQGKSAPAKKPWGATLAAVLDPDGNTLGLAQRGTMPE